MDNTVMLGVQIAAAAAAADASGGIAAVPEGGESFSAVLAAANGQTVQAGQEQAADGTVTDVQTEADAAAETAETGTVAVNTENAEENLSKTALDVIIGILESTEDDGTLQGMKILAKAVLKSMLGDSTAKKKTDLFSFMGEGYDLWSDTYGDYDMFLTGTELLSQIGTALKSDLAEAVKTMDTGWVAVDVPDGEETVSPLDGIIAKLEKIVNSLYSADEKKTDGGDEPDAVTAADMLAALLDVPADVDLDYVLAPAKEQAIEAAAETLTAAKEIVAEESPEDVPKMERLFEEVSAEFKYGKTATEREYTLPEKFTVSFAAVKINNAAEQLKAINGQSTAEAAAMAAVPETVRTVSEVPEETAEEIPEAEPVETQITEKITERLFEMKEDNGTEELIMVLKPENLGQVAVKLVKENGAVSVLMAAQYDEVGKLMAERAANLGGSLQSRDVQVKDINVVDPSNAAEQMGLNFTNQGFSFARNFGGSPEREGSSYRNGGVSGIEGIDVTETTENIEIIREARLWTTA
ncbi:MAG: flagellar hook-length control protein FliK [Ruminococcus sp.]|nr:flagellar hook-length control protein FliK [Ruminococcus sp.]MCM1380601.1 flagellar hook-length control protein FliK [Muribaculaceae bacterium]MCM1478107.1 flagellar hook-length control protein FliK [Muribaculaceae bacterium]